MPMKQLWKKVLAKVIKALRHIPLFAVFDDGRYEKIESLLMECQPRHLLRHASNHFLIPSIIRQTIAMRSNYRMIDLAYISEDDRSFLSRHELSVDFIASNKPGSRTLHGDFQLDAFSAGGVAAICPFSGVLLRASRSILAAEGNPIFYRFESREVFYLSVGRPGIGFGKLYLYFPRFQAIVLLRDRCFWHGRGEVDRLRAHMIACCRDLIPYLQTQQTPVVCALIDSTHFAHHLWNGLTGVDKVLSSGYATYVDKLIVSAEPLGPIDRIWSALDCTRIERLQFPELLRQPLVRNWLLIRPGDNSISEQVVKGVCDVADTLCPAEVKDEAQRLRQDCWPILWVTIRTGNRTWVSQCSGIPDIVNDLRKTFPKIGLIIDGFCTPYDRPAIDHQEQERVIKEEMACVESIRERLSEGIPLRINVGKPLHESILFAMITDCYLAHHGSLQHKIGWIANCPGVVHSNSDDLRGNFGKHRAVRARENSVVPEYLDPEAIRDVIGAVPKSDNRWVEHFSNYDFDYRVARDTLMCLLRQP